MKKLVGADFEEPLNFKYDFIDAVDKSPYIDFSKGQPYISDYNVLQIKIDNGLKKDLDKGLITLDIELSEIFKNHNQAIMFD